MMHYHICGWVKDEKLAIEQIENSAMLADGLTKAFFAAFFKKH